MIPPVSHTDSKALGDALRPTHLSLGTLALSEMLFTLDF